MKKRTVASHIKGTCSELLACAHFIEKGYEVFRNVAPVGPVDIIAIKGTEILKFDVKTLGKAPSGSFRVYRKRRDNQLNPAIKLLFVAADGKCFLEEEVIEINRTMVREVKPCFLPRNCVLCEKPFTVNRHTTHQRYCSAVCQKKSERARKNWRKRAATLARAEARRG